MDIAEWVIAIVSLLALVFSYSSFYSTKRGEYYSTVYRITERLYEIDKIVISNPRIQVLLKEHIDVQNLADWKSKLGEEDYYTIKSFAYLWINTIDEFISTVRDEKKLKKILEYDEWQVYFVKKLKHPFFREIVKRELEIFGTKFEKWFEWHSKEIHEPLSEKEKEMY